MKKQNNKGFKVFKDMWEADGKEVNFTYIPYTDVDGNVLLPEEILFTDEWHFQGRQHVDIFGEDMESEKVYNVFSPDVEMIFDESGNFPIALRTKEGTLKYIKVSAKTGQMLPIHAGCIRVFHAIFAGGPSAGKTSYCLQVTDPAFHNMIVRGTTCSIESDYPILTPRRKRYEQEREDFKNHILPEPTKKNEANLPHAFYAQYTKNGVTKRLLLEYEDVDGQEWLEGSWNKKFYSKKCFILMIPGNQIGYGPDREPAQFIPVVEQLLQRLRVLQRDKNFKLIVLFSKADAMEKNNQHLKDAFENSLAVIDGVAVQTMHYKGFDQEAFRKRSDCLKAYMKDVCPNLYNSLTNAVPAHNLSFGMIASVGETCVGNRFENYQPFCIDEPILAILNGLGMYPTLKEAEDAGDTRLHKVSGLSKNMDVKGAVKRFVEMMLPEEDEDYL